MIKKMMYGAVLPLFLVCVLFTAGCSDSDGGGNWYNNNNDNTTSTRYIAVGNYSDGTATLINRETFEVVEASVDSGTGAGLVSMVCSMDGVLAFSTNCIAADSVYNVRSLNFYQKKYIGILTPVKLDNNEIVQYAIKNPKGIAASVRGNSYVICGSGEGRIFKYNVNGNPDGTEGNWQTYNTMGNPQWVSYSKDNKYIYVTDDQGYVNILDISSGTEMLLPAIANAGDGGIAVSQEDHMDAFAILSATNERPATLNRITGNTNAVQITTIGNNPYGVACGPSGSHRVYVTNRGDNTVSVINSTDNMKITDITVGVQPTGICADPDGLYVYVTNYGDNTLSVIDTATNKVTKTIAVGSQPIAVDVMPKK